MRRALMLALVLALVAGACGDDDASLEVGDVWSRPSTGDTAALYMVISGGSADVALTRVSVGAEVASTAMIHESTVGSDGAMTMSMLSHVEIAAGESVEFTPGGLHVMLVGLVEPLEVGDTFEATLTFGDGTTRTVTAEVRDE